MVCGEDCAKKADAPALQQMLRSVRDAMATHGLAAYVVSHADAHGSETLADADEFLAALTGFTGSAGTAVLTQEQALL